MCPYAQRKVAGLYREGIYVPQDKRIAYQWELMAARQGYRDASIRLADDMLTGNGCEQSVDKAMDIYRKYADNGDAHCISQIIRLADEGTDNLRLRAISYIVHLAENGDEAMVLRLSNAFMHGDYGLPNDPVQQEEWIIQGAENGNPRFIKAMCELNEAKEDWTQAYRWYKRLAEMCPDSVSHSDLERVELQMLTYGLTDYEVAEKGMDYLFGYHGRERDAHLAFRCLSYAKEKGIMLAYGLLGQMHCNGIGVSKNMTVGRVLLREAARHHDILSIEIFIYGLLMDVKADDIGDIDVTDAIEDGVADNNPYAFYLKGRCLRDGCIYRQSDSRAFELMQRAAGLAYPPAQYQLALLYRDGIGTDQNDHLYRLWLETAALNGYYLAQGEYGEILFKDWSRRSEAFQLMKMAIDQGYHTAQASWNMAKCYMYGIGTIENQALAHDMIVAAAENGNPDAQVQLCFDYFKGNSRISKDYAECARWGEAALANGRTSVKFETAYASSSIGKKERAYELYLELAKEGNPAAMNNLGCLETDASKAFEWYLKAAEKGSHVAQCNVAWKYRSGIGTPKDPDKALFFYHKAADSGYEEAILQLARMYRNGDCTEKNTEEAIKWYKIAVSKGRTGSLIELASIYLFDINDTAEAIRYYKEAAEKGENSAIFEIGEIYEKGIGIDRNMNTALYWYRKAASTGNVKAIEALKRLGANWIVDGKLKEATDENDIETSPE